jgi:hypothetical protein
MQVPKYICRLQMKTKTDSHVVLLRLTLHYPHILTTQTQRSYLSPWPTARSSQIAAPKTNKSTDYIGAKFKRFEI